MGCMGCAQALSQWCRCWLQGTGLVLLVSPFIPLSTLSVQVHGPLLGWAISPCAAYSVSVVLGSDTVNIVPTEWEVAEVERAVRLCRALFLSGEG